MLAKSQHLKFDLTAHVVSCQPHYVGHEKLLSPACCQYGAHSLHPINSIHHGLYTNAVSELVLNIIVDKKKGMFSGIFFLTFLF